MKKWFAALFALLVPAAAIAVVQQPLPGMVWTFFGPTLGADWAPAPNVFGPGTVMVSPSASWTSSAASTLAWTVLPPVGHIYNCTTTQSQCFQETLDTARTYGDSVELRCPGEPNPFVQAAFIASNTNINTHALAQRSVRSYGCNITFATQFTALTFALTRCSMARPFIGMVKS